MDVVVIGGGISGLCTAYEIERAAAAVGRAVQVRVLEGEDRLGGKVDTRRDGGFLVEGGVNGWLSSRVQVDALCEDLGVGHLRAVSSDAARRRFLWRGAALEEVPLSPGAFLRTGLLSPGQKARLMLEPWARRAPAGDDESIAGFVRRRLGPGFLDRLVDPMITGIWAGDPEQLSLRSALPKLHDLEREYGGLVRGLIGTQRQARRAARAGGSDGPAAAARAAGPASSKLVSMAQGAGQLIDAVAARLHTPPRTQAAVVRLRRAGASWKVELAGETVEAERLVLAVPAHAAAELLGPLDDALGREVAGIPYVPVAVVALGWRDQDLPRPLDGFGFLVPSSAGRDVLGTLWDSSVFANRAPPGHVLTRSMVGGARRPELLREDDAALIGRVRDELRAALGISAPPVLSRVIRHPRGIPQYVVGHAERLGRIEARLAELPNLALTGNAYRGVSLAECVTEAGRLAAALVEPGGGR